MLKLSLECYASGRSEIFQRGTQQVYLMHAKSTSQVLNLLDDCSIYSRDAKSRFPNFRSVSPLEGQETEIILGCAYTGCEETHEIYDNATRKSQTRAVMSEDTFH